jgi:hypothetical protein
MFQMYSSINDSITFHNIEQILTILFSLVDNGYRVIRLDSDALYLRYDKTEKGVKITGVPDNLKILCRAVGSYIYAHKPVNAVPIDRPDMYAICSAYGNHQKYDRLSTIKTRRDLILFLEALNDGMDFDTLYNNLEVDQFVLPNNVVDGFVRMHQ